MQPGTNPASPANDIHNILSRFNAWVGRQPGNGNGNGHRNNLEGMRELSYEQAIERHRSEHAPQTSLNTAKTAATNADAAPQPPSQTTEAAPEAATVEQPAPQAELATPVAAPMKTAPAAKSSQKDAMATRRSAAPKNAAQAKTRSEALKKTAAGARGKIQTAKGSGNLSVRKASRTKAAKTSGYGKPEFREVLANTMQKTQTTKPVAQERDLRISVRISSEEQRQIEQCAAHAGMTVSEYLRTRVLTAQPLTPEPAAKVIATVAESATEMPAADASRPGTTSQAPKTIPVLGQWLTLLRQRFLSSPGKFAERA